MDKKATVALCAQIKELSSIIEKAIEVLTEINNDPTISDLATRQMALGIVAGMRHRLSKVVIPTYPPYAASQDEGNDDSCCGRCDGVNDKCRSDMDNIL